MALTLTILIIIIFAGIECASGAPPEEQWNKTYGRSEQDWAKVVQQTSDSGYIIAGRTGLCNPCPDVWVIKTDSKGNEQWNKTFGKTGDYYITFLQQTSDDGYILSGKNESWLHKSSYWLIKTDSKGNEQWNKTYNGVIKCRIFVHQTSDDGYFFAVTTSSCIDKCPEKNRLVKLNSKGEEQWNKTIRGKQNERIKYHHQTSDGAFIIARMNGSRPFFNKWIEKIDQDGNIQWSKSFGEGDFDVTHTSDDGYIIATRKTYYSDDSDLMLIKIDSNAEEQWNKTINGTIGRGVSIFRQTSDSGYILGGTTYTGTFHVDFWLMKIDPEGQEQWNLTYGGAGYEWIDSLYQINDGSYIIGCDLLSNFALIKINPGGEIQWIKNYEDVNSFQHTSDGGFILAGDKNSDFLLIKLEKDEPVPNVSFSYNPGYPGVEQIVTFDATPSFDQGGNITNYQWDFGDGNTTTTNENIITHSYASDRNYTVNLTIHGTDNLISSTIKEVIVQKNTPPDVEWSKTFGGIQFECAYCVRQTSDNGYILTGQTRPYGVGNSDIWLVKTDPEGNEQWNRTYGGKDDDVGISVQQTLDGGFIIARDKEYGTRDLFNSDFILLKTDPQGKEQWNNTFGGIGPRGVKSVQQTTDCGYIIAGETSYRTGEFSDSDFLLLKTDSNGNEEWNRTFGGILDDLAGSGQQTSDGGYIITGTTFSYGAGNSDCWLVKTDSNGNEQWNRTFGGIDSDQANSILETSDGGYIIAGKTGSYYGADPFDFLLVKTDSKGNEQWNRTFGGIDNYTANSVAQTSDGGYIIAGIKEIHKTDDYFGDVYDIWLVKTDSDGNIQWYNGLGGKGNDNANVVRQTSDGGYIIAGSTESYHEGNTDFWLIKLGGISPEPEGGDRRSEEIPKGTPNMPGFSFLLAGSSLLVWIYLKRI